MEIKLTKNNEDKVRELKTHIDWQFNRALYGRTQKRIRFQESWLYYLTKGPQKAEGEVSDYVEPVLRRAVETLRPSILNIFTENEKKAVSFRPTLMTPPGIAELIDHEVNRIFLQENNGYDIIEKCITEALVTGDTFLKVFTEEEVTEEDEFEMNGIPYEQLAPILEEYPQTDISEVTSDKDGLLFGSIIPRKVEDKVRIEHVDFKDIFISGFKENLEDEIFISHRRMESIGSLIERGFDKEKVESAGRNNGDYDVLSTQELINMGVYIWGRETYSAADQMTREVPIYEHYVYTSIFNKKGQTKPKLLQVTATFSNILAIREVAEFPFVHGTVERLPGSFWGISLFDKLKAEQDTLSRLHRVIEANGMFNTYRRYIAVKGAYSKESLLNNRPGSVIEVESPEAVQFFQELPLAQAVYDTISRVNDTVEKTLVSSAGVDVTGSNVSATAAAITQNNAEMKDKSMARVLAYTLFKPLYSLIYNAIKEEKGLPSRADFRIDVNTANDDALLGMQLTQLGSMFAQWSQAQVPVINPQGMIEMAKTMTGCSDEEMSKYFSIPQPTPEEMQAQQEAAAKQAIMEERQNSLLDAQVQLALSQVAKTEVETTELIKKGEDDRMRAEEESLRAFKKLDLQEAELIYEMENPEVNLSISR